MGRHVGVSVWLCVAVVAALIATAMSQTLIPDVPKSQEKSSLFNLWKFALEKQKDNQGQVLRSDEPAPKTYLHPHFMEVINWVPMDSGHPLYTTKHKDLLHEILLDYMVQEAVSPDDPRMTQPDGLQVNNLNGKPITFKRNASGITVEGVPVTDSQVNSDGTVSYTLQESIFGHRQRVHEAWKGMTHGNPFGPPPSIEGGIPPPF